MSGIFDGLTHYSDQVLVGLVAGAVGGGLAEFTRYVHGWYQAGRFRGADFHIAATMYAPIDPSNQAHHRFKETVAADKTHIQELIWLGQEVALKDFVSNPYMLREISGAMSRTKDAGLLLDKLPERAERPLLKKIVGYHSAIPANKIVRVFKDNIETDVLGRAHGISPPTHEHYAGSPHRRVLRAMFIADSQLEKGLPPKEKVHFHKETHANRYETLTYLIAAHRADPTQFESCRVFF